jgi:hypothetical protein
MYRLILTYDATYSLKSFQFVAKEMGLKSATHILGRRILEKNAGWPVGSHTTAGQSEGSPWLLARICLGVIHLRKTATRWPLQFVIPFNNQT